MKETFNEIKFVDLEFLESIPSQLNFTTQTEYEMLCVEIRNSTHSSTMHTFRKIRFQFQFSGFECRSNQRGVMVLDRDLFFSTSICAVSLLIEPNDHKAADFRLS